MILRVHPDPTDLAGPSEPGVLPGLAGVGRSIDSIAAGDVPSGAGRSGSDIDHVRIGVRNCDRSDRAHIEKAVGYVGPGDACVCGFPHPAARGTEVVSERLFRYSGDGCCAPAAAETERTILKSRQKFGVDRGIGLFGALLRGKVERSPGKEIYEQSRCKSRSRFSHSIVSITWFRLCILQSHRPVAQFFF